MSLLTKTRQAEPPPVFTDGLTRISVVDVGGEKQIWCDWQVELPNGRRASKSERCLPEVEAAILALPNFATGMVMAADDTHPRVTA